MTIADRNRVLTLSLALEIAMASLCAAAAALSPGLPASRFAELVVTPEYSWEPRILHFLSINVRVIAIAGALGAWGALCGAWVLRAFRKTTSYEILFFALFACSLAFDALRSLIVLSIGLDSPSAYAALLCRFVYFGRWAGNLSLFAASLYSVGMKHEKAGRDIAVVLFLSVILATLMPINSGFLMESFLFRPGYASILRFAWVSVSALCLVNYLFAAYLKGSRDYTLMGLGVLLAMLGRDILFFMTDPLLCAIGLVSLSSGGMLFIRRCFRLALWQ
jgi:hypothetical protein